MPVAFDPVRAEPCPRPTARSTNSSRSRPCHAERGGDPGPGRSGRGPSRRGRAPRRFLSRPHRDRDPRASGAIAGGPEGKLQMPGLTVRAIDTTGAGDCFNGVLAAGLLMSRPLSESLRRACAAAALSVTVAGAREGMPTGRGDRRRRWPPRASTPRTRRGRHRPVRDHTPPRGPSRGCSTRSIPRSAPATNPTGASPPATPTTPCRRGQVVRGGEHRLVEHVDIEVEPESACGRHEARRCRSPTTPGPRDRTASTSMCRESVERIGVDACRRRATARDRGSRRSRCRAPTRTGRPLPRPRPAGPIRARPRPACRPPRPSVTSRRRRDRDAHRSRRGRPGRARLVRPRAHRGVPRSSRPRGTAGRRPGSRHRRPDGSRRWWSGHRRSPRCRCAGRAPRLGSGRRGRRHPTRRSLEEPKRAKRGGAVLGAAGRPDGVDRHPEEGEAGHASRLGSVALRVVERRELHRRGHRRGRGPGRSNLGIEVAVDPRQPDRAARRASARGAALVTWPRRSSPRSTGLAVPQVSASATWTRHQPSFARRVLQRRQRRSADEVLLLAQVHGEAQPARVRVVELPDVVTPRAEPSLRAEPRRTRTLPRAAARDRCPPSTIRSYRSARELGRHLQLPAELARERDAERPAPSPTRPRSRAALRNGNASFDEILVGDAGPSSSRRRRARPRAGSPSRS